MPVDILSAGTASNACGELVRLRVLPGGVSEFRCTGWEPLGTHAGTGVSAAWDRLVGSVGQACRQRGTGWSAAWDRRVGSVGQAGPQRGTGVSAAWDRLVGSVGQAGWQRGTGRS